MKSIVSISTAIALLSASACAPTLGSNPAAQTLQTVSTQYHAASSALQAYCSVASSDEEIAKICGPVTSTMSTTQTLIEATLNTIIALLAKRAMQDAHAVELKDHCGD